MAELFRNLTNTDCCAKRKSLSCILGNIIQTRACSTEKDNRNYERNKQRKKEQMRKKKEIQSNKKERECNKKENVKKRKINECNKKEQNEI